jgi:hypothetical protein
MSRDDVADIPDLDTAPPQAIQFARGQRGASRVVGASFSAVSPSHPGCGITGLAGEVLAETAKAGSNCYRIVFWPLRLEFPK